MLLSSTTSLWHKLNRHPRPDIKIRQRQGILIHKPANGMFQLHLIHGHPAQLRFQHLFDLFDFRFGVERRDVDGLAVEIPGRVGWIVGYCNAKVEFVGIFEGGDEVCFG